MNVNVMVATEMREGQTQVEIGFDLRRDLGCCLLSGRGTSEQAREENRWGKEIALLSLEGSCAGEWRTTGQIEVQTHFQPGVGLSHSGCLLGSR